MFGYVPIQLAPIRRMLVSVAGLVLVAASPAIGGGTVKLAWDLSEEPDIAGYRVHYGPESRTYTVTVDVGNQVNATLKDLPVGTTYFCAVTAYNTYGLESDYSNEISFTVLPPPAERDTDGDGLSDLFESTYGAGEDLDPLSDLDGDGLSALAEFFHGLDPTRPLTGPLPAVDAVVIAGQSYLRVRYRVDPAAAAFVSMEIERATTLTFGPDWHRGQTVVMSSEPSAEHPGLLEVVARSIFPMGTARMEFFRFSYEVIGLAEARPLPSEAKTLVDSSPTTHLTKSAAPRR